MKLHEIPTPALVVDLPAMERNIERMADYFAGRGLQAAPALQGAQDARDRAATARGRIVHRPHLRDGRRGGGRRAGAAYATTSSSRTRSSAPARRRASRALAAQADIIVAVDSDVRRSTTSPAAAQAAGAEVGVLVDVNVGLPRCGIAPGEPAVALARRVDATEGVVLRGADGLRGPRRGHRRPRRARGAAREGDGAAAVDGAA